VNQASTSPQPAQETAVTVERRGHVLLMGLNRPVQIVNIGATVSELVNLAALSAHDAIR
jgi:phosphotransacetylase